MPLSWTSWPVIRRANTTTHLPHTQCKSGGRCRWSVPDAWPSGRAWLEANPRVHCHFTPTHASLMNLVGVWFGIIERQAIHRGSYGSVKDLNAKSERSYPAGTTVATPFVWTKTPEQILKKANHQTTSNTTQLALAAFSHVGSVRLRLSPQR